MTIPVTHYADVRVTGDGVPQIMGTLVTRLHGFMVSRDVRLAVAFPRYKSGERQKIGEVIRFFGESDILNALLDDLDGDERERWMCGRVKETPAYDKMAAYLRIALPSRPDMNREKSARFAEYTVKRRASMLEEMKELPFFFVRSQSAQVSFPVTVEKRVLIAGDAPMENAVVNTYGFSSRTATVPVPEF